MVLLITTAAKVKLRRGDIVSSGQDAFIAEEIESVSDDAQIFLNRWLDNPGRRTERYPIEPGRESLSIKGFPLTQLVYVKYGPTSDFSTVDALDPSQYVMNFETGVIRFTGVQINYANGFVEISYNGGMATDTADFVAKYPAIANAAAVQVAYNLARAKQPDGNVQALGSSTTYTKEMHLLEVFEKALIARRRMV